MTVPCSSCRFVLPSARLCRAPGCTTTVVDWYSGITMNTYFTIKTARSSTDKCGPNADWWEPSIPNSSLPPNLMP